MSEKRNVHLFLDDMNNAIHRILQFTQDMTYEEFLHDLKTEGCDPPEYPGTRRCGHKYSPGDLPSLSGYRLEVYHRDEESYYTQVF
jgi:hypothetical protein